MPRPVATQQPLLTSGCRASGPCGWSCRRKTFTNLTADQLALARDGVITESLRAASPVFYWQTTRQRRSRREAICSKSTAWHAITFGSHGKFADLAQLKCRRAARVGPPAETCTNLTLADLPPRWAKANGAARSTRGAGYWKWKPYTLLRRLQAAPYPPSPPPPPPPILRHLLHCCWGGCRRWATARCSLTSTTIWPSGAPPPARRTAHHHTWEATVETDLRAGTT